MVKGYPGQGWLDVVVEDLDNKALKSRIMKCHDLLLFSEMTFFSLNGQFSRYLSDFLNLNVPLATF